MRKSIKLIPVALGMIALASCSNDEFTRDGVISNAKMTMELNVAEPSSDEDASTRSIMTAKNLIYWQTGDKLRAYDQNLQKYNVYTYNKANDNFTTDQTYVTNGEEKYVLFPSDKTTYAGWKGGSLVALMSLANDGGTLTYSETKVSPTDDTPAYISNLPMFGKVKSFNDGALQSAAVYLTGALKIVLENGYAGGAVAKKITGIKVESLTADGDPNTAMPLWGLFDAQLDDENEFKADVNTSKLVKCAAEDGVVSYAAGNATLTVSTASLSPESNKESVVFIPIVPGTYPMLKISYECNGAYTALATLENKTIQAHHFYTKDDNGKAMKVVNEYAESYTPASDAASEVTTEVITAELASADYSKGTVKYTFNTNGTHYATSALSASLNTIYLPQLESDLIIDITDAAFDLTANELNIKDATSVNNSGKSVTIKFGGFKTSSKLIDLNTTANVTLYGDFANLPSSTTTTYVDAVKATKVGTLTLGDANTAGNTFAVSTVEDTYQQVKVVSGNLIAANVKAAEDATHALRLVKHSGVASQADEVTINSANIGALTDLTASTVTIKQNVATVATQAATVNIAATVANLNLSKGVSTVNLTDGIITTMAQGATAFAATDELAVVSSGSSSIGTVGAFTNSAKISYTSSFEVPEGFGGVYVGNDGETTPTNLIYTAAQLASIGTTNANKLMCNVTALTNWTPIALVKNFNGNGKTISSIDAPLFSTITDANVDGLTINGATITGANNKQGLGILAKEAAGTDVTITNVSVKGDVTGYYYCGGLIGKSSVTGTLTFGETVTTADDKPVTSEVEFDNLGTALGASGIDNDAASFGTFVGAVKDGKVVINDDCVNNSPALDKADLLFANYRKYNTTNFVIEATYVGNSDLIGQANSTDTEALTYGGVEYKKVKIPAADFTATTAGLSKSGQAWTLNVYTIDPLATANQYTDAEITTIKTNIGFVDGQTFTINYLSHNTWQPVVE